MNEYTVEVIFEPTGDYMHFTYEGVRVPHHPLMKVSVPEK